MSLWISKQLTLRSYRYLSDSSWRTAEHFSQSSLVNKKTVEPDANYLLYFKERKGTMESERTPYKISSTIWTEYKENKESEIF